MKRVIVTGANGQLGLALKDVAKDFNLNLVFKDKSALDITDAKAVNKVFFSDTFDVCINAAAYTDVDAAETNKSLAFAINATAVETLAKVCKQHQCWLIHVSTDYVFDGTLNRPYTPSDVPNPLSVYGSSKLAGERVIQEIDFDYSIVRTSWLYSRFGVNFYTKIKSQIDLGIPLKICSLQIGAPTRTEDFAKHIISGLENNSLIRGLSHYCGKQHMTWFELAKRLFPNSKIERDLERNLKIRPLRVVLKN